MAMVMIILFDEGIATCSYACSTLMIISLTVCVH